MSAGRRPVGRRALVADHALVAVLAAVAAGGAVWLAPRAGGSTGRVVVGLAAAVALAIAVGWLLARRRAAELARAVAALEAHARGDFGTRLAVRGGDAFAAVAVAVNDLGDAWRTRLDGATDGGEKVRAILGAMTEGVVAVDRHGRVVHVNERAARWLGCRPAAALGREIGAVGALGPVAGALQQSLRTAEVVAGERRLDGGPRERFVELVAAPFRDGNGDLDGAVAVLQDVSELRRLEAIRRDFVANVSHELKTPITAIRGIVETVLDDEAMPAATRTRFLGRIRDQSLRLSRLVTDLLTLSRLESDGYVLEHGPLDLRGPLRACVAEHRPAAEDKGLALDVTVPEAPLSVAGDADALALVFHNLVANAIQYTPAGGRVDVRAHRDGGDAVVEVRDTGVGIEQKHLDRIFQRFYRVDKARSRELGGTGLGLSIVRHVLLGHGGDVAVESAVGEGSTFRVRLPAM